MAILQGAEMRIGRRGGFLQESVGVLLPGRFRAAGNWDYADQEAPSVLIGQLRVDDLVAVLRQKRRLYAARHGLPAMKAEDFHTEIVVGDIHTASLEKWS